MDNDLIYEASWDYAKSVISDTEKMPSVNDKKPLWIFKTEQSGLLNIFETNLNCY